MNALRVRDARAKGPPFAKCATGGMYPLFRNRQSPLCLSYPRYVHRKPPENYLYFRNLLFVTHPRVRYFKRA